MAAVNASGVSTSGVGACEASQVLHPENVISEAAAKKAVVGRIERLRRKLEAAKQNLSSHLLEASESYKYYKKCVSNSKSMWKKIKRLTEKSVLTRNEENQLESLKDKFSPAISADYQMSKLLRHWGTSEQPGESYYLRKYKVDIFGIVNESTTESECYLVGEEFGSKDADTTISLLDGYIDKFIAVYPWIKNLHVCMDNSRITKCNAVVRYMQELSHKKNVQLSYLVPGHTKFEPDRLFSRIAGKFRARNVFTIKNLVDMVNELNNCKCFVLFCFVEVY